MNIAPKKNFSFFHNKSTDKYNGKIVIELYQNTHASNLIIFKINQEF